MLTSAVWILAGITAWCVASLALALIVGPMIKAARERDGGFRRPAGGRARDTRSIAPVAVAAVPERRAA